MKNKSLDHHVLDMLIADEIRVGAIPLASRMIYMVDAPWTMVPDPYCVEWTDPLTGEDCAIPIVGVPQRGKEFVLFSTYDDSDGDGKVKLYVFYRNQYHTVEE